MLFGNPTKTKEVILLHELFTDSNGKSYQAEDILHTLQEVGAGDCETLFIHSDVMFGRPAAGFRRNEYLKILYQAICELGVVNIIVPTFTYSFCNHEDYDVRKSKTSMGALNEFVRNLDGRYRSLDPILSISVPEQLRGRFEKVSEHSLGVQSGLDIIHHMDGVKFLFFGADMADCFTYVHYVEKMMDVPYRFDMPFEGNIVDYSGIVSRRKQFIHTQCRGADIPERYGYFEDLLFEKGMLRKKRLGDRFIACLDEKDAYREIKNNITRDINYYLATPFVESELKHEYTYDLCQGRITHC